MKKEKYLLKSQIHFSSIKTLVPAGTVVCLDRDADVAEFNGVRHEKIVAEVDRMIKAGYVVPCSDAVASTLRVKQEAKIEKMPVIHEKSETQEVRGIQVIRNDTIIDDLDDKDIMRIVNDDTRYIPIKKAGEKRQPGTVELAKADDGLSDVVNGQEEKVVKYIGKGNEDAAETKAVSAGRKLTAKHADDSAKQKASERAKARKESIAKRHAKESQEAKQDAKAGESLAETVIKTVTEG